MEERKTSISFSRWKPIEIMLAVLFLVAPFYYHPNIGGEGLRIPNNITVWMTATIIIWYSLYLVLKRPTFVLPKYFGYIVAFPILITLSGFVTGVEQPLKWLFRLLFIWGGLAFFFSLFQHGLKQGRLDRILFVIVVSALLQGLVGVAQIFLQADMPFWLPKTPNGVPTSLFQQINNHATYQVTAIMIAVYLITRPFLSRGKFWVQVSVVIAVACASFIVAISGSRIGAITLIIGLVIIIPALWQCFKENKRLSLMTLFALLIGFGIGVWQGNDRMIDKTVAMQSGYSGSTRLGIYSISLELIKQRPIFGHGIGSFGRIFQYAKPDFYKSHPDAILPKQYVSHPHNETLLWLVEGGLTVGVGLLSVLVGVILALRQIGWRRGGAYAAMLLPIGLHMQVELPIYISAVYWMLFVYLMAMALNGNRIIIKYELTVAAKRLSLFVTTLISIISLLFLMHSLLSHQDFRRFYQQENVDKPPFKTAIKNPYLSSEAMWLKMSSFLYSSIELGLNDNVKSYTEWGEQLLLESPDIDLYKKLAAAYNHLGQKTDFCSVISRGLQLYPEDIQLTQYNTYCMK